jgi:hypothetical protein
MILIVILLLAHLVRTPGLDRFATLVIKRGLSRRFLPYEFAVVHVSRFSFDPRLQLLGGESVAYLPLAHPRLSGLGEMKET